MNDRSRRQFVAGALSAAAVGPFISTEKSRAQARNSGKKIGYALCGLGGLSENIIAPAFAKSKHCRLTAVVTGSPEKAGAWRAKYDIPEHGVYNYDTLHKMADNPDIDAVYVVTPNALHLLHTVAAAKAGKHVLCEKPLEISVERCRQMIDACKAENRLLATAYRCQFDPVHLECIRLGREKIFGPVRLVEAAFGITLGKSDQWRLDRALAGGGALVDVGVYVVQAMRYLTGEEPNLITAIATKTDPVKFKDVDESMAWTAKFPSGAMAYCSTSYNLPGPQRIRATAAKGWYEMDPAFGFGNNVGRRSDGQEIRFPNIDLFAAQVDDLALCIREQRPSKVAGEEGMRDVKVMQAIYAAARTGKAVTLS